MIKNRTIASEPPTKLIAARVSGGGGERALGRAICRLRLGAATKGLAVAALSSPSMVRIWT
jgi:hypothetical protein